MPHLSQLTLFITGTIIIVVIPGPNILYLIARSIHQGRMAGLASVLGIEAATVIHMLLSFGLVLVLLATLIEVGYVLLASRLRTWLKGNDAFSRGQRYFAGSAYIGLGLATALSGSRHK